MYKVHEIVVNNLGLFTGWVRDPPYMAMDQEERANVEWQRKHNTIWDVMEPFSFLKSPLAQAFSFI